MMIGRVIKRAQPHGCDSDSAACACTVHTRNAERGHTEHRRQNKPPVFTESEKINPLYRTAQPDPLFPSNRRRCFCQTIRVGMQTLASEKTRSRSRK